MSRTYRFRHDEYIIREQLHDWVRESDYYHTWYKVDIDPQSIKGRRTRAQTRAGKYIMHWHGPSWFRRRHAQVPYRRRAKRLIHNYLHGKAEDVILETKPYLPYWY